MKPEIEHLINALAETRAFLRLYGDKWLSAALEELEKRLAEDDWSAIETVMIEATGGMGSLRDRWLSLANGDNIRPEDEGPVNDRLDALIKEVERCAKEAALALRIAPQ